MRLENYSGLLHEDYITRHNNRPHELSCHFTYQEHLSAIAGTEGKINLVLSCGSKATRELTLSSRWMPEMPHCRMYPLSWFYC